jgi:hypothetical protein
MTEPDLSSLDFVELVMLMEEHGVRLTEAQGRSVKPYLVPIESAEMQDRYKGKVTVFARRRFLVLAIAESQSTLIVGRQSERGSIIDAKGFASPGMAVRAFLSD